MKWLQTARPFILDILVPGTGVGIVWSEALLWIFTRRTPDTLLMTFAAAALFPSARAHVKTVLGSPEATSSSPSTRSRPSAPSSSPAQPEGEPGEH